MMRQLGFVAIVVLLSCERESSQVVSVQHKQAMQQGSSQSSQELLDCLETVEKYAGIWPAMVQHATPHGQRRCIVWHDLSPEETRLISFGRGAREMLLAHARDGSREKRVRIRDLQLVALLMDKDVCPPLIDLLAVERDKDVVEQALRALALSGGASAREAICQLFGTFRVETKRLLWALAVLGDLKAEEEYLGVLDAILQMRPKPQKLPEDMSSLPRMPGFERIGTSPYSGEQADGLIDDLADAALLKDFRAVLTLILALSCPDLKVVDYSAHLLGKLFDERDLPVNLADKRSLYSDEAFPTMLGWWKKVHERLRWESQSNRFVLKKE